MTLSFRILLGSLLVLTLAAPGMAQRFTVQQPVISQFGLSTSVSVPDRGTAFLGSTGRAGFSRLTTGPLRWGSSVGRFSEHRGANVSVYIHDFEELERQLLAEPSVAGQTHQRSQHRNVSYANSALSRLHSSRFDPGAGPGDLSRSTSRPATDAEHSDAETRITETSYGRAHMARRRNLDKMRSRIQSSRRFR